MKRIAFNLMIVAASLTFLACGADNENISAQQNAQAGTSNAVAENTVSDEHKVSVEDFTWYTDFNEGMAAAAKAKKPVIVDFYTDWCGYCKKMDKETFEALEIKQRFADGWVAIKVNAENKNKSGTFEGTSMSYPQMTKYFRVSGFPTYVFFDKEGKMVAPISGFRKKGEFGPILDYLKAELYTQNIRLEEYIAKNRS